MPEIDGSKRISVSYPDLFSIQCAQCDSRDTETVVIVTQEETYIGVCIRITCKECGESEECY